MKGRILVVILFFWAVLAVMTPLLVQWSAALKLAAELDGVKEVASPQMRRFLPRRGLVAAADELAEASADAPLPPAPTPEPGNEVRVGGQKLKKHRHRRPSLVQGI